jgi:Tfp pilus assembly protein PilX
MKSSTPQRRRPASRNRDDKRGMALMITMLLMLLIAAVAVASINQSGEEASAGGRTRATARNLYAAESGLQLAQKRLSDSPLDVSSFSIMLEGGRRVESRRRSDGAPQALLRSGIGPPPEGYEINTGSSSFYSEIYLVNITSSSPAGTTTELEAKVARLMAGSGGQ